MNYVWLNSIVVMAIVLITTGLGTRVNNKKPLVKFIVILAFLAIIQITVLIMATQIEWIVLED